MRSILSFYAMYRASQFSQFVVKMRTIHFSYPLVLQSRQQRWSNNILLSKVFTMYFLFKYMQLSFVGYNVLGYYLWNLRDVNNQPRELLKGAAQQPPFVDRGTITLPLAFVSSLSPSLRARRQNDDSYSNKCSC